MEIKKITEFIFEVEKTGKMQVPVRIIANDALIEPMARDGAVEQGINVATCLPGIYEKSIMLADAHKGYGFSIGGVAAIDSKEGCISPGGIGFDINCGVRVLSTNLTKDDVFPKINELLDVLFKNIPSGVGSESKVHVPQEEMDRLLKSGALWALEKGFGTREDIIFCEEEGHMKTADPSKVSPRARKRGKNQLGTLGAGNHFLEIQVVDEIFDVEAAKILGFDRAGQIAVMIHCGSRGLGHQVCSDYLRMMEEEYPLIMAGLPEKDLIYAPILSRLAKDYIGAMSAAANFAWANRHVIAHFTRQSFKELFPKAELKPVYDIAHNIAKKEVHCITGEEKTVWVHRKGATRSFPPGHKEIPVKYRKIGQPVLIPGSMGTSSYILLGTQKSMSETFGSSAHGAGRQMSRFRAKQEYPADQVRAELGKSGISVKSASNKGISEEAPGAYKDVSMVIDATTGAGIAKKVIKLVPLGVIKG